MLARDLSDAHISVMSSCVGGSSGRRCLACHDELERLTYPPATSCSVVRPVAVPVPIKLPVATKSSTLVIRRSGTSVNRDECRQHYLRRHPDTVPSASGGMSSATRWKCQAVKKYDAANFAFREKLTVEAAFNAARTAGFAEGIRVAADLVNLRYRRASLIVASAVNDIRSQWMTTEGTYFHRAKVVNKLIAYYIVSLAIYIIEICFWTNGTMIRVMGSLVLEPPDNTRIVYGMCIAAVFLLLVYLVGGEGASFAPTVCEN